MKLPWLQLQRDVRCVMDDSFQNDPGAAPAGSAGDQFLLTHHLISCQPLCICTYRIMLFILPPIVVSCMSILLHHHKKML